MSSAYKTNLLPWDKPMFVRSSILYLKIIVAPKWNLEGPQIRLEKLKNIHHLWQLFDTCHQDNCISMLLYVDLSWGVGVYAIKAGGEQCQMLFLKSKNTAPISLCLSYSQLFTTDNDIHKRYQLLILSLKMIFIAESWRSLWKTLFIQQYMKLDTLSNVLDLGI